MQNATEKNREYIEEKQIEFAKGQSEQVKKDIEGIINSDLVILKEKSKLLTSYKGVELQVFFS